MEDGFDDTRAPAAHFLHTIEQVLGNDRLVQAADGAVLAAQAADVPAIGGVQKNLAHGVLGERSSFR